jgi:hypothetical protein
MKPPQTVAARSLSVPAILDVEASGFGAASYPVEVGLVLADGRRYCSLIAPAAHWAHWDPGAAAMHGLTREHLAISGKPVATVARELNALAAGQTLYCDGWAVDYPWLRTLYQAAQLSMSFRVSAIEMLLSEQDLSAWDDIKAAKREEIGEPRHRASGDAWVIQETYRAVVAARAAAV